MEARDRSNQSPEEVEQFDKAFAEEWEPLFQKWNTFTPIDLGQHPNYTDYLVLEKH